MMAPKMNPADLQQIIDGAKAKVEAVPEPERALGLRRAMSMESMEDALKEIEQQQEEG